MVRYSKLEVKGEWNSNSNQPAEVLISFGSISLSILDINGEPLRQWAYSSIFVKNKGSTKSMFCPDMEETESLYIFDTDAVNHLIFLCNKTKRKKLPNLFLSTFIIIFLIIFSTFFANNIRDIVIKIAISITLSEQENNIGDMMINAIGEVPYCDTNKIDEHIQSSSKDYLDMGIENIELILINLAITNGILLPGGKLLVPISIIDREKGAIILAQLMRSASEAMKARIVIEKFFSKQHSKALLFYIFGNFTALNFDKDNGLYINVNVKSNSLDVGLPDREWFALKSICQR